jgi:hypothetical protein
VGLYHIFALKIVIFIFDFLGTILPSRQSTFAKLKLAQKFSYFLYSKYDLFKEEKMSPLRRATLKNSETEAPPC